jgi:septal ring factor EnvC (AmiA/AmiB activator)
VPEELKTDFDWKFLAQLVLASFSSDYELKKTAEDADNIEALKDLYIAVKSGDQSVVKTISELWSFQILRLYEIYIEEQINLHALMYEDEKEKVAIQQEREMRTKRRQLYLETMDKDELKAQAKKEQEGKLGNLYDQL